MRAMSSLSFNSSKYALTKLLSEPVVAVRLPMLKPPLRQQLKFRSFRAQSYKLPIIAGARIGTRRGYQEGRRRGPLTFLKVVSSTADSVMNMITAIMMARTLVDDACATGAG